jgi:CHASE2 domain-containing sensor protein
VIVLIASAEHLPSLQRGEFASAQAFSDAEALRALETITREKPAVVALEQLFASTSRGTALVSRIKADPTLGGCEIRIISNGGADAPAPEPSAAPAAPPDAPLDQRGTRRAPRFKIVDGVEVSVDGNPATLIDLSIVGAQVLSPTILRPNQRLRLTLPDAAGAIRVSAQVAWASFEMPKGGVRYRAGLEFLRPDADALTRFLEARKK